MNKLSSVIGPAPSELSRKDLLAKLKAERQRIVRDMDSFLASVTKKGRRKKATRKPTKKQREAAEMRELKKLAKDAGISLSELRAAMKEEG